MAQIRQFRLLVFQLASALLKIQKKHSRFLLCPMSQETSCVLDFHCRMPYSVRFPQVERNILLIKTMQKFSFYTFSSSFIYVYVEQKEQVNVDFSIHPHDIQLFTHSFKKYEPTSLSSYTHMISRLRPYLYLCTSPRSTYMTDLTKYEE